MVSAAAIGGSPSPLWYATRGTGVVAMLLLTASVVLGIVATVRFATPRWPRMLTGGLHRNVSLLVLAFLAVHITTAVLDSFAPIGWVAVVVPFVSAYRPLWLGLGTVAFDLLLALTVSSLLRGRLGYRAWRYVHWAAYACWPVALAHGLGTGTDTRVSWVLAINAGCVLAVLIALGWRLASGWPQHAGLRLGSAAISAVAPVVLAAWLTLGPLAPHWAARAGTPAALLTRQTAGQPATAQAPTTGSLPAPPFTAELAGTVRQSAGSTAGQVAVTITLRLSGGATGQLTLVIDGMPDGAGGVSLVHSQVTLGPASAPQHYQGRIVALAGTQVGAQVAAADGQSLHLDIGLRIAGTQVSGSLQVAAAGR